MQFGTVVRNDIPVNPPLSALLNELAQTLKTRSGTHAVWAATAPGRVNLIGDHTDYSQGFALPMGIDLYTTAVAAPRADSELSIRVFSTREGEATLQLEGDDPRSGNWADYLRGVLKQYRQRGFDIPAMDLVVGGNLPLGAGLSSSASLELCFATLIEAASGRGLPAIERALLCQQAEHDYAGVPCGILDQFAVTFATEKTAMLLDCREQSITPVDMPPDIRIAIIDSGVSHALADGGYAERRTQVEGAESALRKSLRDARETDLATLTDDTVRRRARHVVRENARVQKFAAAVSAGDLGTAGQLMYASHESLSRDFAVSCEELDTLVSAAKDAGAIGARMTGGGFGGSMVAFVSDQTTEVFERTIIERFRSKAYQQPTIRWVVPAAGARAWDWT